MEQKYYKIFGKEEIDIAAIEQMNEAMALPISIKGALMPDAHVGYGLPIGGVLATYNAVIPYAVGMDIGCTMFLSYYTLDSDYLFNNITKLRRILIENTHFGRSENKDIKEHEILERPEFNEIAILKRLKDKAYSQLGTSGTGNHFVDIGIIEFLNNYEEYEIEKGQYLAVLSHSGSRGMGAEIATYYSRIAKQKCDFQFESKNLAWLDINSNEGIEYWKSMTIAGDYALANHFIIHNKIAKALGCDYIKAIYNRHNFAWKDDINLNECVVIHRKGATLAYKGDLGIIPGSMASPAFVVQGKGNEESLFSASHGAGRITTRKSAKKTLSIDELHNLLKNKGIELIGGDVDESPLVYKDIYKIMNHQKNLVSIIGVFNPKIVRMN